jgi:uncharacterized protein DUF2490
MARRSALVLPLACLLPAAAGAQTSKQVDEQTQVWLSLNTTARFSDRWGLVADVHVRRNHFLEDPSFYLLRVGAHRWLGESLAVTVGYAHNFVAPAQEDWHTWTNEDRIYQQVQYASMLGRVRLLHRLRNEQRWQQEVENDILAEGRKFSDRVRYLVSLTIPFSSRPSVPSLVLSDEVAVQFGPDIVANTFDQNRLFLGLKKTLSPAWSFDLGYMLVYQQKASGYQYDLNHTLRWFFYFTPDRRRPRGAHDPASSEE